MIFGIIFSSFATDPDISSSTTTASCADAVLNTNGGNVNIEINWEPNVIPLRWYNGNTMVESNTCTYGGGLNIPEPPAERTGYTFRGWRVRPTYDFTQLDNSVDGSSRFAIAKAGNQDKNICYYGGSTTECNNYIDFAKLQRYEWKVVYNYGTVYGMSKCSTSGSGISHGGTAQTISETEGAYCFCKVTGFQPTGESTIYGPSTNMKWVEHSSAGDTYCLYRCAYYCTVMAGSSKIGNTFNSAFRARLFGQQD